MKSRWLKILGTALLALGMLSAPAYAQKRKQEAPKQAEEPKPVGQYIILVILLALPFGLICRSNRRM